LGALRNDFSGCEPLRRRLDQLPKFGQGDKAADDMAQACRHHRCDIYDAYVNRLGGRVKSIVMTFVMAPAAGASLGASADGRRAGTPISQGLTPQSSAMTDGLTTAMGSANTLPLHRFSGGASTMWDLDPALATVENIKSILKVFIATGGQIYQGKHDVRGGARTGIEVPGTIPEPPGEGGWFFREIRRPHTGTSTGDHGPVSAQPVMAT